MLVYAVVMSYAPGCGYWPASFEVIAPPPRKKVGSSMTKIIKSRPMRTDSISKSLGQNRKCFVFGENLVTPISTLANYKRTLSTNSTTPGPLR